MKVTSSSSIDCFADETEWPPGFRFHPTDEELVLYYLKRKICRRRLKLDIIAETDVYKWDPEELPGQSILKTGDRQWFFFSPRDRKYPNGARSNRATRHGYWKATGKDRSITCNSRTVGTKKTLVFYRGRAPSGGRTDWVMHEYVVDEEELNRCKTDQDYYVLYKLYKKSGPGPKNGEQYGAPFKEEVWADEENSDANKQALLIAPTKPSNAVPSADNARLDCHIPPSQKDIEIANRLMDDHPLDQLHINGGAYLPQDVGDEELQSTMVDPSVREPTVAECRMVLHPSVQEHGVQPSFDITRSFSSQLQSYEAPEVTSAPKACKPKPQYCEDDFLEINDLIDPVHTPLSCTEKPVENFTLEDLDGLSEFDLFHDAAMFIRDMGPVDQEVVENPCFNIFNNEMVDQFNYQHQMVNQLDQQHQMVNQLDFQHEMVNQLDFQHQMVNQLDFQHQMVNQCDYQLSHIYDPEQINRQILTQGQGGMFTSVDANQGSIPQAVTGVVCDGTSNNMPAQENLNQTGKNDSEEQWLRSALWAFVDSIPTTPASASENAFVNRAFERMSSFSRVRINQRNADATTVSNLPPAPNGKNRSRGFFYFSIVGAVCAIFWVLMNGTIMSVLGRYMTL